MIFTPTLECGGSERYVSVLCNHLGIGRFEVTLVVLNNAHPFYEMGDRVELVNLGIRHVRNALFAVKKIIEQKKPDIIYSTANHLNLLFATFRWMFPKKTRFVARESSIVSINSQGAKFPELYKRLIRKFYDRFDMIICQSKFMQQDLVDHFNIPESKTVVIPNPVGEIDIREVKPPLQDLSERVYKFITVARLSPEKGIDRVLRSLAAVSVPFQYHIIGEGGERKNLEKRIRELKLEKKVFLTGEKVNPYHQFGDADLFLMGSRYEGFPNVLVEAGMLGIPVVAFDAPGGIGEVVRDADNGFLVKDGDENGFAAAIEKALKTVFNRHRIIAVTKERYAADVIIPATEDLLIQLLL